VNWTWWRSVHNLLIYFFYLGPEFGYQCWWWRHLGQASLWSIHLVCVLEGQKHNHLGGEWSCHQGLSEVRVLEWGQVEDTLGRNSPIGMHQPHFHPKCIKQVILFHQVLLISLLISFGEFFLLAWQLPLHIQQSLPYEHNKRIKGGEDRALFPLFSFTSESDHSLNHQYKENQGTGPTCIYN